MKAVVVGAGLAGSEAAWQLAKRGVEVELWEMKPRRFQPVHTSPLFAELVCSNSLRSSSLENAVGILKEEMRRLDSLVMRAADATAIPAGGALAVDRAGFSRFITEYIRQIPNITVVNEEATAIPDGPCVVATGPLTDGAMAEAVAALCGGRRLHFYDAVAPIVTRESVDMTHAFELSRWGRGSDYINCPLTEPEYDAFWLALTTARTAELHGVDRDLRVFEGCMPAEVMACRGRDTLRFGPMKPIGLTDPKTGRRPFAVVQLRRDNAEGTQYNIVGFQTRLAWPEQKRVFGMIPALARVEFARYGVMHRNTYVDSPGLLGRDFSCKNGRSPRSLYFAGQMTGVEGYVESAASGLVAGLSLARELKGMESLDFTRRTVIGALGYYIEEGNALPQREFVPMNANFGIMEPLSEKVRGGGRGRRQAMAARALDELDRIAEKLRQEETA
jgi:methylenetetrahydrofolate--tRNA-(uracil-5-)-methyltransferase